MKTKQLQSKSVTPKSVTPKRVYNSTDEEAFHMGRAARAGVKGWHEQYKWGMNN